MGFRSPIQEVERFLKQLRSVLDAPAFDIDRDIVLIQKNKPPDQVRFSTPFTLIDLDYAIDDVVETLKGLQAEDYSETLFDKRNDQPPLLFVFGADVRGSEVYVKVKIKQLERDCILCISFHYAQYPMSHPYA